MTPGDNNILRTVPQEKDYPLDPNTIPLPPSSQDYREFIWSPKIDSIKRPVRNLTLQGLISTVHSNSGLVKRCNKCKSIIYDSCPNKCSEENGWGWDLRVSSRLYDGSGSIKMVLTKDIASRILHMNLGELILLATTTKGSNNIPVQNYSNGQHHQQFQLPSVFTLKIPDSIDIIEAVTESNILSSSYRSSEKLIVTDGRNLVYFPQMRRMSKSSLSLSRGR